jgi:hypothetical protein
MKTYILGRGLTTIFLFFVLSLSCPLALLGGGSQDPSDTQSQDNIKRHHTTVVRNYFLFSSEDSAVLNTQIENFTRKLTSDVIYEEIPWMLCDLYVDPNDQNVDRIKNSDKIMAFFYFALKEVQVDNSIIQDVYNNILHGIKSGGSAPLTDYNSQIEFLKKHNVNIESFNRALNSVTVNEKYQHAFASNCNIRVQKSLSAIIVYSADAYSDDSGRNNPNVGGGNTFVSVFSRYMDINLFFNQIDQYVQFVRNQTVPRTIKQNSKDKAI